MSGIPRRQFLRSTGVVAGSFASGCSASSSSNPTQIRWITNFTSQDKIRDALHNAGLAEDIYIKFDTKPMGWTRKHKLTEISGSESTVDLIDLNPISLGEFFQQELLSDIHQILSSSVLRTVDQSYFKPCLMPVRNQSGALYALPYSVDVDMLCYRTKQFQRSGHETATWACQPPSWSQLSVSIDKTLSQTNLRNGFLFPANIGPLFNLFRTILGTWGGRVFRNQSPFIPVEERSIGVTSPAAISTLRMLRTFIYGHDDSYSIEGFSGNIAPETVLKHRRIDVLEQFKETATAMAYLSSRSLNHLLRNSDGQYGVTALPFNTDGNNSSDFNHVRTTITPTYTAIPAQSVKKETAGRVLETFHSEAVQRQLAPDILQPPRRELFATQGEISTYRDALLTAATNSLPPYIHPNLTEDRDELQQIVHQTLRGDQVPSDAMKIVKHRLSTSNK